MTDLAKRQRTRATGLAVAPYALVVCLWAALYPGIFSDDSLGYWSYASSGQFYSDGPFVWLAWIWVTSVGGHLPGLSTLAGVLLLVGSIDYWTRSFAWGRFRPWLLLLASALPTVWAIGVTLWKDVPMTAGFFLAAGLITRAYRSQWPARWLAAVVITAAGVLVAMRANGPATAVVAALALIAFALRGTRRSVAIAAVSIAGVSIVSLYVPQVFSNPAPGAKTGIEVAGVLADVGCAIQRSGISLSEVQLSALEDEFGLSGPWWQAEVCMWTDALYRDPNFATRFAETGGGQALRMWASVAADYPRELLEARAYRVSNQLPWPTTGAPRSLPFIQSVVTPNDMGIEWASPITAEGLRIPMRLWNALRIVTGSPGLWLLVSLILVAVTWRRPQRLLVPTVAYMTVLQVLVFAFSPFSESRYGLLTLIAGPLLLAGFCVQMLGQRRERQASALT